VRQKVAHRYCLLVFTFELCDVLLHRMVQLEEPVSDQAHHGHGRYGLADRGHGVDRVRPECGRVSFGRQSAESLMQEHHSSSGSQDDQRRRDLFRDTSRGKLPGAAY